MKNKILKSKIQNKILDPNQLVKKTAELKSAEKKIVFTNGCFDILHKGHVQYLSIAADKGDVLIVAINSDASVKRQNKGDNRPINPFDARATLLAALSFVDFVVEFDEETPQKLIELVHPNVLVKGADYDPNDTDRTSKKYIVGREIVLAHGGKVEVIDLVQGYSTTAIIRHLEKHYH